MAETIEEAVRSCVYTMKLSNTKARTGPTGLIVYSGEFAYSFLPRVEE